MSKSAGEGTTTEISQLAQLIVKHKRLYYTGNPQISDQEYDQIEDRLRSLDPTHPALEMVGADTEVSTGKVAHDVPMLSLEKTYDPESLVGWIEGRDVMATLKLDGNSLSLIYENGQLDGAKTRGNGRIGEDVTPKAKWVSECIPKIALQAKTEIRGELYCTESRFIELSEEMKQRGLDLPSNPRNIVAGVLGRKQHVDLARFFSFAAFDVLTDQEGLFETEEQKFHWLEEVGFKLPNHRLMKGGRGLDDYLAEARSVMEEDEIGIDGVVFTLNELSLHRELGSTSHHPRFKISFKWQGEVAQSKIESFTWATSRLGIVTPVAVIEPVELSGAKITNVTLHNAAHVKIFNLKIGDLIEIVRSGEVIPKFLRVIEAAEGEFAWPETCPSCGHELEFDGVRLACPDKKGCSAQQLGKLLNWIKQAGIDDLSEKRLTPLVEMGMVSHPSDLYRLTEDDFLKLPLTKEKMARKLRANIQGSRSLPLANFLSGLGIQGAGLTTWEALLAHYPTLEEIRKASWEELIEHDGFAEKSAKQITEGLVSRSADIDLLLAAGVSPSAPRLGSEESGAELSGQVIAITGTLSRPRAELEALIKKAGGKPASSVSSKTSALVIADLQSTSSKAVKARQLGIPLWSEEDLVAKTES